MDVQFAQNAAEDTDDLHQHCPMSSTYNSRDGEERDNGDHGEELDEQAQRHIGDRLKRFRKGPVDTLHILRKPTDDAADGRDVEESDIGRKDAVDQFLVDLSTSPDGTEIEYNRGDAGSNDARRDPDKIHAEPVHDVDFSRGLVCPCPETEPVGFESVEQLTAEEKRKVGEPKDGPAKVAEISTVRLTLTGRRISWRVSISALRPFLHP